MCVDGCYEKVNGVETMAQCCGCRVWYHASCIGIHWKPGMQLRQSLAWAEGIIKDLKKMGVLGDRAFRDRYCPRCGSGEGAQKDIEDDDSVFAIN